MLLKMQAFDGFFELAYRKTNMTEFVRRAGVSVGRNVADVGIPVVAPARSIYLAVDTSLSQASTRVIHRACLFNPDLCVLKDAVTNLSRLPTAPSGLQRTIPNALLPMPI